MRFGCKTFQKSSCEPRFADARVAGNQHHPTLAALSPRPAPQQQLGLFLPPDEGSQATRMQCLEAAFNGARSQCQPSSYWLGDALQVSGTEVL